MATNNNGISVGLIDHPAVYVPKHTGSFNVPTLHICNGVDAADPQVAYINCLGRIESYLLSFSIETKKYFIYNMQFVWNGQFNCIISFYMGDVSAAGNQGMPG